MVEHRVTIDRDRCAGCGLCARVCVAGNIKLENGGARTILDSCIACGHCAAVCPLKAVLISGYDEELPERREDVRLDPEDVLESIRMRRSVRQFEDRKIPRDVIEQIIEAGRLTHTAKNAQDVSFVVLEREKDRVEKLAVSLFKKAKPLADIFSPLARNSEIGEQFFFFGAPAVIVVFAKDKTNGVLAAQNMEFVAQANGLGVLFSGFFVAAANLSPRIKRALNAPGGKKAAATLVLGYPDVKYLRAAAREKADVQYM